MIQHLAPDEVATSVGELARVLRPRGLAVVRTNAGRGGIDVGALRATFEGSGFRVLRATRVNFAGSLAQEVRGRLRPASHRAHPGGGVLPDPRRPDATARIMAAVGRAEAFAVGRLGWSPPFGHSAMMLAVRPAAR